LRVRAPSASFDLKFSRSRGLREPSRGATCGSEVLKKPSIDGFSQSGSTDMSSTAKRFPKLCRHKASNHAIVTIDGRDIYLGPSGSDEAQQRYDRIIAEWLQRGRQSGGDEALATVRADRAVAAVKVISQSPPISVNEVCLAYVKWVGTFYVRDGELTEEFNHVKRCIRVLSAAYGSLPAAEFGPLKLKAVRERFIIGDLQYAKGANRAGKPQARPHINANIMRIKRIFSSSPNFSELAEPPPRLVASRRRRNLPLGMRRSDEFCGLSG
jgi:hypothetical protein